MPYKYENFSTYQVDEESGETKLLANFIAKITHQTTYLDGINEETKLTINGQRPKWSKDPNEPPTAIDLPEIVIPSHEFSAAMPWVQPRWGTAAFISPGYGVKDNLRAAIQLASNPTTETVYRTIGWVNRDGKPIYLHSAGAIGEKGPIKAVRVQLPPEMALYQLPMDAAIKPREAINATLEILKLAPQEISWALIAAAILPLHGPVDFAFHLAGKTGTFKSEVASIVQSHYGPGMDARHLPGAWSSTANAIEVQAYLAANAVYVLDDFLPGTTSWQAKAYQQTADRVIRAQGNQSGRARLSDTSNLQTTYYPRGLIFSTGEDVPEGHSVRARLFILDIAPGDINAKQLTKLQGLRQKYAYTTMYYAHFLAANPAEAEAVRAEADLIRDKSGGLGHARTPAAFGRIVASLTHFLKWAQKYVKGCDALIPVAVQSLTEAAKSQATHLETTDPTDIFQTAIRQGFAAGLFHVRTTEGGIPKSPDLLGWTKTGDHDGMPTYKSHGPNIGWASWKTDELFIDATSGMQAIRKTARNELQTTVQTLIKRLKDSGLLTRADASRQRNTIRIVADGHTRTVISLRLTQVLDTKETPTEV